MSRIYLKYSPEELAKVLFKVWITDQGLSGMQRAEDVNVVISGSERSVEINLIPKPNGNK